MCLPVFPLICGMIGSAVAAVISVGAGTQALSIGVGGIPGILSINPKFWGAFALAMAAAIVVPFVLTWLVGQKKLSAAEKGSAPAAAVIVPPAASPADEVFIAPMSGRLFAIEDIDDQGFASKSMGDGIAIELQDGVVVAPFSGTIEVAFPTGHAYGIACDNGRELLIHLVYHSINLFFNHCYRNLYFVNFTKLIKKLIFHLSFVSILCILFKILLNISL